MSDAFAILVEVLQAGIFTAAQSLGGSLPAGIIAVTFALRVALLPITFRVALRARAHSRRLRALAPALSELRTKYSDDPRRLSEATLAVYQEHGVRPVDGAVLGGTFVQLPVVTAFFQAVRGLVPTLAGQRFLWIRDLAAPSLVLACVTGALVLSSTFVGADGTSQSAAWPKVLPAVLTVGTLLFFSSAFGLYMFASSAVGLVQAGMVRWADRGLDVGTPTSPLAS